jgi:GTP-binding protein HflX
LLYSLGYGIVHTMLQKRGRPDPATFLGSGKVEELQGWLADHGVKVPKRGPARDVLQRAERKAVLDRTHASALGAEDEGGKNARKAAADGPAPPAQDADIRLVAVNANLKPNQIAELERLLGVDVYDRVRVILEIFERRAQTKEARLQVELARLRYERPLVREYIHLAKRGEHAGFMAGGAYAVDQYYDTINGRIARIQQELGTITREREVRRKHRRRGGFYLVSLAGYTNAGKSSLLKQLSGEDVLIENRMFSTLETRTGRAEAGGRRVLVTDTVGFVEGLPPELVKAFRSTLEEIAQADVIVLVLDAHDAPDEAERKLATSLRVLRDFHTEAPMVLALNKSDRTPAKQRGAVDAIAEEAGFDESHRAWISAKTGDGVEGLVEKIVGYIPPLIPVRARMDPGAASESMLATLYDEVEVERVTRETGVVVDFLAPAALAGKLAKRIRKIGGTVEGEGVPSFRE